MITPEQIAKPDTEHAHQAALFCWAAQTINLQTGVMVGGEFLRNEFLKASLQNLFAIPNGDQRGDGTKRGAQIAGGRLKAEGQKNGVPDVMLAWSFELGYKGLFIEMKRPGLQNHKDGGCSKEQLEWHERLRAEGYCVVVCYSWIEARDEILKYLGVT